MPAFRDLTGQRFGRLTASSYVRGNGRTEWLCRCDCGKEKRIDGRALGRKENPTRSCGCIAKEVTRAANVRRNFKHGHSVGGKRSKTFDVWTQMMQRCNNANNKGYARYGGRGIGVCERWRDFTAFLADMGEAPKGLSIERIDNDAGYSPGNCVWAGARRQVNNRRTTVKVEIDGKTLPLSEWCESLGLNYYTVHSRITRLGWSPVEALRMRGDARYAEARRRQNGSKA
jgi:hypothetical protein